MIFKPLLSVNSAPAVATTAGNSILITHLDPCALRFQLHEQRMLQRQIRGSRRLASPTGPCGRPTRAANGKSFRFPNGAPTVSAAASTEHPHRRRREQSGCSCDSRTSASPIRWLARRRLQRAAHAHAMKTAGLGQRIVFFDRQPALKMSSELDGDSTTTVVPPKVPGTRATFRQWKSFGRIVVGISIAESPGVSLTTATVPRRRQRPTARAIGPNVSGAAIVFNQYEPSRLYRFLLELVEPQCRANRVLLLRLLLPRVLGSQLHLAWNTDPRYCSSSLDHHR